MRRVRRMPGWIYVPLVIAILIVVIFVGILVATVILATLVWMLVSAAHAILSWIGVPT